MWVKCTGQFLDHLRWLKKTKGQQMGWAMISYLLVVAHEKLPSQPLKLHEINIASENRPGPQKEISSFNNWLSENRWLLVSGKVITINSSNSWLKIYQQKTGGGHILHNDITSRIQPRKWVPRVAFGPIPQVSCQMSCKPGCKSNSWRSSKKSPQKQTWFPFPMMITF